MRHVRFLPQDQALLRSLDSPDEFRTRYDADISGDVALARDVIRQTLEFEARIGATRPWTGYLSACSTSGQVVGCGGFKGNPTPEGTVEIAYFTFPEHEGRGFGSATARELIEIARENPGPMACLAHTLPETNASTRILDKAGFTHVGEVNDPEDGPVWRWRLELQTDPGS